MDCRDYWLTLKRKSTVTGARSEITKVFERSKLDNSIGRVHKEEKLGLGSASQEETIQSLDKSWLQIKKEGRLKCRAKNTNSLKQQEPEEGQGGKDQ